jgi:phage gpG-like protein
MVILTLETIGDQKLVRGFNRFTALMKDFTPVFRDVAEYFYKTEEKVFNAEGDPEMFLPLSPKYREWKRRHYPGRKIMELTGRLKESLTGGPGNAGDTVKTIGKTNAEFGTKVPYAHRHQMGTHGMPQRKIVQMTETRKRIITKMIHDWSFRQLQGSLRLQQGISQ